MDKLTSRYLNFRHHPGSLYTSSKCSCSGKNGVIKFSQTHHIKRNGFVKKSRCFACGDLIFTIPKFEYTGSNKQIKYSYKNFNNSTKEYKTLW